MESLEQDLVFGRSSSQEQTIVKYSQHEIMHFGACQGQGEERLGREGRQYEHEDLPNTISTTPLLKQARLPLWEGQ